MSLASNTATQKSLPPAGKAPTTAPDPKARKSTFMIQATYTDNGATGIKPLTNAAAIYLRNNTISAGEITETNGFNTKDSAGARYLAYPQNDGWLKIPQVDLTGIKAIELTSYGLDMINSGTLEVRIGKSDGAVAGRLDLKNTKGNPSIPIQTTSSGLQDVYIVFKTPTAGAKKPLLASVRFVPSEGKLF